MDFGGMEELLKNYHEASDPDSSKRTFPSLPAGSYYQGYSSSEWPSWSSPLGNDLGFALPADPLKESINPPFSPACQEVDANLDARTCYYDGRNDPNQRLYVCPTAGVQVTPDDSHIYLYHFKNNNQAELFSNLEFRHQKGWASDPLTTLNPCSGLPGSSSTKCSCFNYVRTVNP